MKKLIIVLIVLWFSVAFGDENNIDKSEYCIAAANNIIYIDPSNCNFKPKYIEIKLKDNWFKIYLDGKIEDVISSQTHSTETNKQEVIQYFIDSGYVCEVIGHDWRTTNGGGLDLCRWENGFVFCRPNPNSRKCTRCGKKQKQEVPDWEDVD